MITSKRNNMKEQEHLPKKEVQLTTLEELMPLIREQLSSGHSVQFSPKGTSMLPMLREGMDRVVLSPLPAELKKYDLPLYQRRDGKYVLHRIVGVGETYAMLGDNQFTREPGIRREQMIGVVTTFYRGKKVHSVNELPYRIYCRLWVHSRRFRALCSGRYTGRQLVQIAWRKLRRLRKWNRR